MSERTSLLRENEEKQQQSSGQWFLFFGVVLVGFAIYYTITIDKKTPHDNIPTPAFYKDFNNAPYLQMGENGFVRCNQTHADLFCNDTNICGDILYKARVFTQLRGIFRAANYLKWPLVLEGGSLLMFVRQCGLTQ